MYHNFKDRFGNEYGFATYAEFSIYWFNLSRKIQLDLFPDDFKRLNSTAVSSKEAKVKIY